ncbi:MAG: hypothetical protein H0W95_10605 [Nocardioidaceae bacterium]|nr:hypothetical protein [Nocardioidaceae bacterium]
MVQPVADLDRRHRSDGDGGVVLEDVGELAQGLRVGRGGLAAAAVFGDVVDGPAASEPAVLVAVERELA